MPDQTTADLLRPHLTRLYRLAYRLTGNRADAEDLVQDVLVKVCARPDELVRVRVLFSWLCRVLYNQFIDDRRRYGRMPIKLVEPTEVDQLDAGIDQPENAASRSEEHAVLAAALQKLSEDQRVVVLLHDAEGYKLAEIEALTGTPIGTLKSRLHRARARLAEILKKDGTFSDPPACQSTDGVRIDAL